MLVKNKLLLALCAIILIVSISCQKKSNNKKLKLLEKKDITTEKTTSMQDIANDLNFIFEDSSPFIEDNSKNNNSKTIQNQKNTPAKPPETPRKVLHQTLPPEYGEYTAQLLALKDKKKVEDVRRILASYAYYTEIITVNVNGSTMYRLRLSGSFSKNYAEYLASKIKSEFEEVSEFWVTKRE
jgi:hypothetical protein